MSRPCLRVHAECLPLHVHQDAQGLGQGLHGLATLRQADDLHVQVIELVLAVVIGLAHQLAQFLEQCNVLGADHPLQFIHQGVGDPPCAMNVPAVGKADVGDGLGVGIDDGTFTDLGIHGYLAGYRLPGYQGISLCLDLYTQVALPSITLGAFVDGAMGDAVLIGNLAEGLDASPVVQLNGLPVDRHHL